MELPLIIGVLIFAVTLAIALPAPSAETSFTSISEGPRDPAPSGSSIHAHIPEAIPMLGNPSPVYPNTARRLGYEGRVVLEVEVRPDGQIDQVRLVQSSGYGILDRAALGAARGWRFDPAYVDDLEKSSQIRIPVSFQLPN